jgi:hypothetical protein
MWLSIAVRAGPRLCTQAQHGVLTARCGDLESKNRTLEERCAGLRSDVDTLRRDKRALDQRLQAVQAQLAQQAWPPHQRGSMQAHPLLSETTGLSSGPRAWRLRRLRPGWLQRRSAHRCCSSTVTPWPQA